MTTRWVLTDPATSETWMMPINPNAMTSPQAGKNLQNSYGIDRAYDPGSRQRVNTFLAPPSPTQWEWSGVIRSKDHYDAYVHWTQKPSEIHVTDHLGRTWEVLITAFAPEDRVPTQTVPWRLTYSVKALILRRLS